MESRIDGILSSIAYSHRPQVRSNLLEVYQQYGAQLQFKKCEFIHNNGLASELCMLDGVLPMIHKGIKYNIPIQVFITDSFPADPPRIYVRPTRDMLVSPNHPYIEPDGTVNISQFMTRRGISRGPPGTGWTHDYRLYHLLHYLSLDFGEKSPLYTKQSPMQVNPPVAHNRGSNVQPISTAQHDRQAAQQYHDRQRLQQQQQYHQQQQQGSMYAYPPPTPDIAVATLANEQRRPSYGQASADNGTRTNGAVAASNTNASNNHANQKRHALLTQVTEKLTLRIIENVSKTNSELQNCITTQAKLQDNDASITDTIIHLNTMMTNISSNIIIINNKIDNIKKIIIENEVNKEMDPEDRLLCSDALSSQIVDIYADDDACEDCIYQLDSAIQQQQNHSDDNTKPILTLQEYLRSTRQTAHKQFMKKSHMKKILDQLANMNRDEYSEEVLKYWRHDTDDD